MPASHRDAPAPLTWLGIARLGLVQTALGAIFVLSTSTLNRVMKVELALPAVLPGLLIALQYWIQVLRPRLGHGSDLGGRRTPFIIGGMAVLAGGGVLAAVATGLMTHHLVAGLMLATLAFAVIGIGVSAAGTALLVLLAARTAPTRRPAAATLAWLMMIVGFIVTAGVARALLDPFSPGRLVLVAIVVAGVGFVVSCLAVWGVEGRRAPPVTTAAGERPAFAAALREAWAEPQARRFAIFVFVSMLAYGGEELMIEPFAGALFAMTPGQTAGLSGLLHGGSLAGMILVGILCTLLARSPLANLRGWMIGGCLAGSAALVGLAASGLAATATPLKPLLFALGAANGCYAIAAIATMMQLVGARGADKEGVRMGLWGAAQGVAFGCGGLAATIISDAVGHFVAGRSLAYAAVFTTQAAVFVVAAALAFSLPGRRATSAAPATPTTPMRDLRVPTASLGRQPIG